MKTKKILAALVIGAAIVVSCKKPEPTPEVKPATVVSIEPSSAKANAEIVVTGTNFSEVLLENAIVINDKEITPYEVEILEDGTTKLYAAVPSRLGSGKVAVRVKGELYTSDVTFEYIKEIKFSNVIGGVWGVSWGTSDPTEPKFNGPLGACADEKGQILLVEQWQHCIRKINPVGPTIALWAGAYGASGCAGGSLSEARFNTPKGIVPIGKDKYVVFSESQVQIIEGNTVKLLGKTRDESGEKVFEGKVENVSFCNTNGAAYDEKNNLVYFGCNYNDKHFILKYDVAAGTVSVAAGSLTAEDSKGNVDGDVTTVGRVTDVSRMTVASDGTLYFIQSWKHNVRKLSKGILTTVAGQFEQGGWVDGDAATAKFNFVAENGEPGGGIVEDEDGNFLIADPGNHAIRKMTPDGVVTTISAMQEGGPNKWAYKDDYDPNMGNHLGATQYCAHPIHIFKIAPYTYGFTQYTGDAPGVRQIVFE